MEVDDVVGSIGSSSGGACDVACPIVALAEEYFEFAAKHGEWDPHMYHDHRDSTPHAVVAQGGKPIVSDDDEDLILRVDRGVSATDNTNKRPLEDVEVDPWISIRTKSARISLKFTEVASPQAFRQ